MSTRTRKYKHSYSPDRMVIDIECPFCGHVMRLYTWSLATNTKKCKCGAIHNNAGETKKPAETATSSP